MIIAKFRTTYRRPALPWRKEKDTHGNKKGRSILVSVLPRLKTLLACIGALLVLIVVVPPAWYGGWLTGPWTDARAPVLIVLGGDFVGDGMMGESSLWRSVYAVSVWREGAVKRIVISGDAQTTFAMRTWLITQGVPADAVTVEDRSQTTRENAMFTAKLLHDIPGPYMLLSSDIHMWRAERVFQKAGITASPRPAPDAFKRSGDWRNRVPIFLEILDECAKIAYYKSKGWI
jgi:uncharacterized SAM-binding protein YcdF (DUF218 family)